MIQWWHHFRLLAFFFPKEKEPRWSVECRVATKTINQDIIDIIVSHVELSWWVRGELGEEQKTSLFLHWSSLWGPRLRPKKAVLHAEASFWQRSLHGFPNVVKLLNGLRRISLMSWTWISHLNKCGHLCLSTATGGPRALLFPAKGQRVFQSFSLFLLGYI